jgi:hypothetical protein
MIFRSRAERIDAIEDINIRKRISSKLEWNKGDLKRIRQQGVLSVYIKYYLDESDIYSFLALFTCVWLGPDQARPGLIVIFHDFSPMTNKENGNPLEDEEEVK